MVHACVDLAVRIRPRAAFAEEKIRLGVEHPISQKSGNRPTPLGEERSTVKNVNTHATPGQSECGEQARRATPHHSITGTSK